jgi:hypothetical protein
MNRKQSNPLASPSNREQETALDRILTGEEELLPTSGFLAAVMERVEQEAAAPAPIPFPWLRLLPGLFLALGLLAWAAFALLGPLTEALRGWKMAPPQVTANLLVPLQAAAWVTAALAVSLLSWCLSRRLAGRGGLL